MQLYMVTRGQKDKVDAMVRDMQAQYFPYKANPHQPPQMLQLGVRPVQFWEIAFPEPCKDEVINMLELTQLTKKQKGIRRVLNWAIRFAKWMGLEPIPEYKTDDKGQWLDKEGKVIPKRIIFKQWVAMYGLGIKEDEDLKVEGI